MARRVPAPIRPAPVPRLPSLSRVPRERLRTTAAAVLCVAAAACGPAPPAPVAPPSGWHEFEGTWSGAGTRRILRLGGDRQSAIVELRGSLLLAGPGRPGVGFRSEVIGMSDRGLGFVGRGVWTDERGDQIYSELKGEGTAAKNRITGTILGGTGRFAGATGSYEFSWQYILEAEDGSIQGRASGLKGRVRVGGDGSAKP